MLAFIILSLLLSYLVQSESPYQNIFIATVTIYLGLSCIAISIIGAMIKKNFYSIWYDLFATGALLTWFSYWHQFFHNEAPMFYLFPLYFAFLIALVSLLFISKRDRFDQESVDHIRSFDEKTRFHPGLVVFVVTSRGIRCYPGSFKSTGRPSSRLHRLDIMTYPLRSSG